MIISASRRTDIPAFYSAWLMNRLAAGTVKVKNPFNPTQVRAISLRPQDVDCFIFWTKNPTPMFPTLDTLDRLGYTYYFQFTLTPYGPDMEPGLPPKTDLVNTFRQLSGRIGSHRVVWRYDPIILNDTWDTAGHICYFERLCAALSGYTRRVVISFVDLYKKVRSDTVRPIPPADMHLLAKALSAVAQGYGLALYACCEALDFASYGIERSACIDRALIEAITGRAVAAKTDRGQRPGCGCCQSVDIGVYNTCGHGCVYCYANHSPASSLRNRQRHDPMGAWL